MTQATKGHLAMLLFSLLVAGSFSIGTRIANFIDPTALMAMRFALAGLIVGSLAYGTGKMRKEHFKAPWRYVVLGALFAIYFALMFEGLKTASPVSAAAVFTLSPIMTAVFSFFLLGNITTRWMASALFIGALGALWVIFRGDINALLAFDVGRGEMVYFIGCISHSIYTPMIRKLNRGEPTLVFTFGMIVAGMFILASLGAKDLVQTDWSILPWYFWGGLLYLAVCASSMTFLLLQFSAMALPGAKVMAYSYLTPSWVILLEIGLTGVLPPALILVGVVVTIIALLMLLRNEH